MILRHSKGYFNLDMASRITAHWDPPCVHILFGSSDRPLILQGHEAEQVIEIMDHRASDISEFEH